MTNPVIDKQGTQRWFNADGKQHRDNDLPAEIYASGSKLWYCDGKRHRDGDLPAVIWTSETKFWYRDGKQHRDGDLPAVIWTSGLNAWYRDGKLHRDGDLPAVAYANGLNAWWRDGKRHRDGDLPAVIYANGDKEWYRDGFKQGEPKRMTNPVTDKHGTQRWFNESGNLHRDGDLPAVMMANGDLEWYCDGKRHRDSDLPAVTWVNGAMYWYRDGKLHRDGDLPAVIWTSGTKYWYRDGIEQPPPEAQKTLSAECAEEVSAPALQDRLSTDEHNNLVVNRLHKMLFSLDLKPSQAKSICKLLSERIENYGVLP